MARKQGISGAWDAIAGGVSLLCLVHCLGLPLLLGLLPAIGSILHVPHSFHVAMLAIAVPASAIAMQRGYRHHGILLPALLGAIGLLLLGLGAMSHDRLWVETGFTVCGSVTLALAHLRNWRLQLQTNLQRPVEND